MAFASEQRVEEQRGGGLRAGDQGGPGRDPTGPVEPTRSSPLDRLAAALSRVVLVVFLARVNNNPGSSDSCGNLALARNLAEGRGYVTGGLGELWIRQPLDAPDTIRPPGLPYLLAAVFAVTGVSLAVPVTVNAVAVGVNALALRAAVRRRGGRWAADLALTLTLLSYNYEMVSVWNNNAIAACTSVLLLLASGRRDGGRPGPVWLPVGLAACSAVGFLMKQTFLLTSWPFAFLVLATDTAGSRSRRAAGVVAFVTILLALTSVYWGRNLARHGAPFYSPSFSSARLAARYGFLPNGPWRTLRFDRPATYGEVFRTLGPARVLLVEVKTMAKTVFYSVCMNPAVALCAAASVLFWRPCRWRDYAGVAALGAGVVFEVGVYNHHEFRYLWPLYPCMLFLAWLTVRDFEEWGATQVSPCLKARFRTAFALVGASALFVGAFGALENWRIAFEQARRPTPGWVDAVKQVPPTGVVLTADVGPVVWWAGRRAVVSPLGGRDDLATVIAAYDADYYLATGPDDLPGRGVAFSDLDLVPVDRGEGWGLYRIVGPIAAGDPRPSGGRRP